MKHWTVLKSGTALAICMTGSTAFADISAQDVWGAWKDQMAQAGYAMSANEAMSGSTLTVSDINMTITLPQDDGTVLVDLDRFEFVENGDGTVNVVVPSVMPIDVMVDSKSDGKVIAKAEYRSAGMTWTVAGVPDAMTHSQMAPSITIALTGLEVDGKPVDLGQLEMTMNDISFQATMSKGASLTQTQIGSASGLTYVVDMTDPEGSGDRINLRGSMQDLAFNGTSQTPEGVDMQDFAAALAAGFGFDGSFSHGGGTTHIEVTGEGDEFRADTSSTGATGRIAMNAGKLVYDLSGQGMKVDAFTSEMPLPISFEMAESAFRLVMPLAKSDAIQGVELALKLGDFTMADMLWGLFDPTGQLPRDPATIELDLTGDVKLTHDLMDEKAMAQLGEMPPGELHAAKINTLTVRAAGAELTGDGAFTFDNTDLTSFDGLPRPQGVLNLMLVGGNGLLDKLVAMGFVPEDQAMGARMMMGLFAVPAGDDVLTSVIEVNEQGHVLANGQRLK
ncbi:MAG: DUF2125 domain-containing protein [Thalassovita sp.]